MKDKLVSDQREEDIEVEGYSVAVLQAEYGMSFNGAMRTLDWLRREPARAKKALAEGYDCIVFGADKCEDSLK